MRKQVAIIDRKSALSGLTVREGMRRLNCYLDRNAPIKQAIRQTIKCKINAVLILNENNEAIGVVSKTNIMGAYYAGLPIITSLDAIMVAPPLLCHLDDSLDLRQGFPLAVNDFWRPVSKTPVMIDAGKADILKR